MRSLPLPYRTQWADSTIPQSSIVNRKSSFHNLRHLRKSAAILSFKNPWSALLTMIEAKTITVMRHLTKDELEAGLDDIRNAPKDCGTVQLIVRRPETNEREVLEEASLDLVNGLLGDNWKIRGSGRTDDGSAHPDMQLNVMNARVISLLAQAKENWSLAGDQLYLDLDLSADNLPVGARLKIGSAVIEVTPPPHTGCQKFVSRFGLEAMKFVNSELGRKLRLRGLNAKVIQSGTVRSGDEARKLS
jgi:hypothetical protein